MTALWGSHFFLQSWTWPDTQLTSNFRIIMGTWTKHLDFLVFPILNSFTEVILAQKVHEKHKYCTENYWFPYIVKTNEAGWLGGRLDRCNLEPGEWPITFMHKQKCILSCMLWIINVNWWKNRQRNKSHIQSKLNTFQDHAHREWERERECIKEWECGLRAMKRIMGIPME